MRQSTKDLIESKPTYGELTLTGKWEYRKMGNKVRNRIYVEALCTCNNLMFYLLDNFKMGYTNRCVAHLATSSLGTLYGEIKVKELISSKGGTRVIGQCGCGSEREYELSHLKRGNIKKCKHHSANICIGNTFGKIKVIELLDVRKESQRVLGLCVCGSKKEYRLTSLKSGNTKSCGCISNLRNPTLTRPEITFLNELEPLLLTRGLTIKRQFSVNGYRLDAYIPELNIAIEYDEKAHRKDKSKKADIKRQLDVEDMLGCAFIRVSEKQSHAENITKVFEYFNTYVY